MEQMSKEFLEAFGISTYNAVRAIDLYDKELKRDPANFAALHNRGVCKLFVGRDNNDIETIRDGKRDIRSAIEIASEVDQAGYPLAEGNLKFAEELEKSI